MIQTTDTPETCGISASDFSILTRVVRDVARARRLSPDDAAEFEQTVHVKLLERKYDVFSRFRGESSLRTYLTSVVTRLFLDWRNSMYGKWRSSAAARRRGPHAVALERLIVRDGYSIGEAVQTLGVGCTASPDALEKLAGQLPGRTRRRVVGDDALANLPAPPFVDPIAERDRKREASAALRLLAGALDNLPSEDRLLLRLRYAGAHSVVSIGRMLHAEPKKVYRRLNRTLRRLRQSISAAGAMEPMQARGMTRSPGV
jgi:RNA polymerase sigma factor for flagellar operon FliA